MDMYGIRSEFDLSSIGYRFLTIKEIGDEHFSKIFNIYIPIFILKNTTRSAKISVVQI